jgi:hypothetical protein
VADDRRQAAPHRSRTAYDGAEPDFASTYEDIDDDMLRLIFVAYHPVLAQEARVALTLKLLGGLTTAEIARAYLSSEAVASVYNGLRPCSTRCISSSMNAMPQRMATTCCDPSWSKTRCAWAACSRD